MTSLGHIVDYKSSTAYDVSADGDTVVGISRQAGAIRIGVKRSKAFRWDPNTSIQELPGLPGELGDSANAISPDGTIIVGRSERYAYVWDSVSGDRSLGGIPNYKLAQAEAFDVSADGRVIVGKAYIVSGKYRAIVAFIWTPDHGMRRLRDALLDAGVDPKELSPWSRLYEARAVSADGNVIVGYGHRKGYGDTAFRVELAPPNTRPTVTIMRSTSVECVNGGANVEVTAEVFDEDGDDLDVTWFIADADSNKVEINDTVAMGAEPVTIQLNAGSYSFGMGSNRVVLSVSDGVASVTSKKIYITVMDSTAPFAVSMMDVEVGTDLGECFATVDLTTEDFAPVFSDGCNPDEITVTNNAPENNRFNVGTTTVTWTVSDAAGNTLVVDQQVTVVDDEAPVITSLPEDVVFDHDAGECHADVVLVAPEATDNCGVVSISADPAGPYPVGDTLVTWTARDEAGNISEPVMQTVTVTNEAPIADAGPDQVFECDGSGAMMVTLDGTASYDPDGDEISFLWEAPGITFDDPESATPTATFPDGSTTVTLMVKDHCDEMHSTDVLIIIHDTTAPQIQANCVDKKILWPPNHKMTPVVLDILVSDLCTAPEDLLLSCRVSSSEADDAEGDGKFVGDTDFADGFTEEVPVELSYNAETGRWEGMMNLRAERSGNGDGRKYTIRCFAMDESGNITEANCCVAVPHSLGKKRR